PPRIRCMTPKQRQVWDRLYALLERAGDDDPCALADLERVGAALDAGVVTQRALARVLGVTPRHVRNLVARGRIPELRLGAAPRYDLAAVCEALGAHWFPRTGNGIDRDLTHRLRNPFYVQLPEH